MFSSRIDWDQTPNPLTEVRGRMLLAGEAFLDLTDSNPTRCGFAYPEAEILRAIADPGSLVYAPESQGLWSAREAVAGTLAADVDPGRIVLTASTSEAYSWIFKLLCDPGDEVLVPCPSYPLFDFLARMEAVRLEPYPLVYEDRWRLDLDALVTKVTQRTRALVVIQPNNPTGSYLDEEEIDGLRRFCSARGLPIISDEVFFEFVVSEPVRDYSSLVDTDDVLVFGLGGLSKLAGLPQMKLSWIVVTGATGQDLDAVSRLELIGDTYLSVGAPVQKGLGRLLHAGKTVREQILQRVRANRRFLDQSRETDAAWECLRTEGGWSAVLRLPGVLSELDWAMTLLKEDRVLVHPGYFYDFPEECYLVVSLLPPEDLFREAIGRLLGRVKNVAG